MFRMALHNDGSSPSTISFLKVTSNFLIAAISDTDAIFKLKVCGLAYFKTAWNKIKQRNYLQIITSLKSRQILLFQVDSCRPANSLVLYKK